MKNCTVPLASGPVKQDFFGVHIAFELNRIHKVLYSASQEPCSSPFMFHGLVGPRYADRPRSTRSPSCLTSTCRMIVHSYGGDVVVYIIRTVWLNEASPRATPRYGPLHHFHPPRMACSFRQSSLGMGGGIRSANGPGKEAIPLTYAPNQISLDLGSAGHVRNRVGSTQNQA